MSQGIQGVGGGYKIKNEAGVCKKGESLLEILPSAPPPTLPNLTFDLNYLGDLPY